MKDFEKTTYKYYSYGILGLKKNRNVIFTLFFSMQSIHLEIESIGIEFKFLQCFAKQFSHFDNWNRDTYKLEIGFETWTILVIHEVRRE